MTQDATARTQTTKTTQTATTLTDEQKLEIIETGFTLLHNVVPAEKVAAAMRVINASLGANGADPAQLDIYRSRTWTPDVTGDPAIIGLLTDTPLWALAESAIAPGEIEPVDYGQIALRFPSTEPPGHPRAHIDGMYSPHNGVPKGEILNFTALVGVYLSDVPTDDAGNFVVWPGSHRAYADYFGREGADALRPLSRCDALDAMATPRARWWLRHPHALLRPSPTLRVGSVLGAAGLATG